MQLVDKQVGAVKQSQLSLIIKEKKNPSLSENFDAQVAHCENSGHPIIMPMKTLLPN